MKKYKKLNEFTLRRELEEQVRHAHDFEWSGWGVDVCVNSDNEIWSSDFNNGQNIYQSDKIVRVERWSVDELDDPNPDRDESINYHVDRIVDELIERIEENGDFEIVES